MQVALLGLSSEAVLLAQQVALEATDPELAVYDPPPPGDPAGAADGPMSGCRPAHSRSPPADGDGRARPPGRVGRCDTGPEHPPNPYREMRCAEVSPR